MVWEGEGGRRRWGFVCMFLLTDWPSYENQEFNLHWNCVAQFSSSPKVSLEQDHSKPSWQSSLVWPPVSIYWGRFTLGVPRCTCSACLLGCLLFIIAPNSSFSYPYSFEEFWSIIFLNVPHSKLPRCFHVIRLRFWCWLIPSWWNGGPKSEYFPLKVFPRRVGRGILGGTYITYFPLHFAQWFGCLIMVLVCKIRFFGPHCP